MRRKAIVLTRFPFTDLSSNKRRPALVLTSPKGNQADFIVAFISSVIPNQEADSDFVLHETDKDFGQTGLLKTSIFKMDKLATLDKSIFSGEVGEVSNDLFDTLIKKLKIALEL